MEGQRGKEESESAIQLKTTPLRRLLTTPVGIFHNLSGSTDGGQKRTGTPAVDTGRLAVGSSVQGQEPKSGRLERRSKIESGRPSWRIEKESCFK